MLQIIAPIIQTLTQIQKRNIVFSLLAVLFLLSCNNKDDLLGVHYSGSTQGTTYSIIIAEQNIHISQEQIEQTLALFDTVFSTYIEQSHVSKINASDSFYVFHDTNQLFQRCYEISQEMYAISDGMFDPSVYPLVNAWGFFDKQEIVPSKYQVDSMLSFIGFQRGYLHDLTIRNDSVLFTKKTRNFKLDFNAVAQGFSVDVIAELIEQHGHQNYFVEIGGEMRVSGNNREGQKWNIGIEKPLKSTENTETIAQLSLTNCGLATSGNYRNFFERNGKKYAHILHPKTGYPILTDIISATVIAPSAALADAYATIFILWGKQKSIRFVSKQKELQLILVYLDENGSQKVYISSNQ